MSNATDELVDVLTDALEAADDGHIQTWDYFADAVLAALVERYGEPEVKAESVVRWRKGSYWKIRQRRLVFPWREETDV